MPGWRSSRFRLPRAASLPRFQARGAERSLGLSTQSEWPVNSPMVATWWRRSSPGSSRTQRALSRRSPAARFFAARALAVRSLAARSIALLLIACAVPISFAQQPSSLASPGDRSRSIDQAAAQSLAPALPKPIPKTGTLPGALRQQADHRFLAQRGIGWESRGGTSPSTALADRLSLSRAGTARAAQSQAHRQRSLQRPAPDAVTPGTWQSLGPAQVATPAYGLVTGRITSLAADPNDSTGNTLYVGSTGGGVWKSTNAAGTPANTTFAPLTDDLPAFSNTLGSLSIGAITVQPTSSSIVLAGTGDPNNALDSYYGVGILRSSDGGLTWTLIQTSKDVQQGGLKNSSFVGNGFSDFAWSSTTPSLVVAAVAQSIEGEIVNAGTTQSMEAGLYYSSDAGQTWYLAVIEDSATAIVQSPRKAGSPPGNSATSVIWNPVRKRFYAAVRFHGYYESLDGITWTRLANQPGPGLSTTACPTNATFTGQTSCPIFRGALAVQPVTGDLFALTTDLNDLDQGLFQDVCSTNGLAVSACASNTVAFGTQIPSGALENGNADPTLPPTTIPLADYDLTLAAVASQQDTVLFAGTEDIYRCSLANSCAWRNTTNIQTCAAAQVAPSQHATESTFGGSGLLYFANDGGLWRSKDTVAQTGSVCASTDASHYQNLNNGIGSLAEVTHFSVSPGGSSTLLAGIGGFGTVSTTTGQGAWPQLLTGEGSYTAIDPANIENWYTEAGSGVDIFRCTLGAGCNASGFGTQPVIGSTQDADDADYFTEPAPWILDPLNTANLLLGTCRVWRGPATGGSGWSASNLLSPMLDGNQQSFCNGNAELRSIAAGLNANAAAGTEQMYAGMAGPYDGGGTIPGHVFGSTVPASGGTTTWTDLYNSPVSNSSNNPQFNSGGFSISSIAVDPHDPTGQTVYVTIQGFSGNGISDGEVYGSTDGGAHWLNLTNSLPLSPANSIVVDPNVPSYLYVALDTGVYYTQNVSACSDPAQTCWAVYGAGLPNAPVTSLEVYSAGASSILEASTYGRGIWALALLTAPAQGTLSPSSHSFASQQVATTSATATFTLANTGTTSMTITDIEVSGDYAQTHTCGSTLAASASCTIQVTFTPTVAGDRPGTLNVYANVSGGVLTSTLDGQGLAPGMLTATPASLSFPGTVQGSSSPVQTVSLQNTGGIAVQLQTLSASTDYQLSANTCNGVSLAPAATCSVGVTFTPSAVGDRPGHLSIPSNLPGSPTLVPLDGSGVTPPALTLSPTSLTFPNTAQGTVSAAQSITLTSSGGATVQLQSPTISGDYQVTSNTCGATLAPAATCVLQIEFAPAATGSRPGLLTQPANVSGGQVTAALNGIGVTPAALTVTPASLTFPSTTQGTTSAAQAIRLTSSGGVSVQVQAPTITGDYAVSLDNCPGSLAPGASCTLQLTFTPTATGDRPGLLTVPASIASGQVTVPLDGTGVSPPELTFLPLSLTFGATAVGSTSAALSLSVTNLGGTVAQLLAPTTTGDFAVSTNGCGSALAPGASCTMQITFNPTVVGTRNGVLTLGGTNLAAVSPSVRADLVRAARTQALPASTAGQVTAALSGTGVSPPIVTLNPTSQSFGSIVQGSASSPQSFTATNTGTIPTVLQQPATQGDYQVSSTTCAATLAAGNSCAIMVVFHPASVGDRSGALVLSGSMSGGHVTATLDGTGLAPGVLTLTPGSLAFGGQLLNTTSTSKTVTVANTGGATLTLPPATISGDYAMGNSCGGTLAGGAHCTIQVTFTPTAAGDRPGQLQQSDGISGDAPQVVTLDGTGQRPGSVGIAPASQAFGSIAVGASSSPATLTVTNSGDVTVHLQTATVTGDYSVSSNCGSTLAGGAACTFQVTFTPTVTGARTGTLTLPSDATNTPATASLSGTGVAPANVTLSPATFTFPSSVVGATSPSQTFTATNTGGVTAQLGASAASSDYVIQSKTCTGTLPAGASCTLQVAFAPKAPGDRPGTLSLPGQFSGSPATAALDSSAVAAGALTLSPTSLTYGSMVTGTTSAAQTITATNTGGVNVTLGTPSLTGAYGFQAGGSCHANLVLAPAPAAGDACTIQIVFSPQSAGDNQGLLTVPGDMPAGSATASLDGTGVAPGALSLSPPLLNFGALVLGVPSAPQTVTLSNTGGAYVDLQAPSITADYQVTNHCGGVLTAGSQCTLDIIFTPTALGDQPGTLTASGSGGAIQAHTTLDGSGLAPARLVFSPASLAFGSVQSGKVSPQQSATLSNTGGVPAPLALPVLTGDYAIASNSCGASLAPAASCVLQITFNPSGTGARPGLLSVATTDSASTATVSLSGTGTPPPVLVLTPTALVFPATGQGATTAAENITVANIGTTPVTLQPFSITGDFAISADTCSGAVLNPTYSCTLSITFTPTGGGLRTGLLTVSDTTETHTATLTGTGLSAATDTLSTTSLTFGPQVFGTVSPGQSVTVTNSGGSTLGSISTAITGPFIAANNCGTILGGGLTCSIAVSFAPTGAGAETGQLTITDAQRSQLVTLGGQGVLPPQAVATPISLDFGGYAVAIASPAQLVTMTNNGKTPLTGFTAATTTGAFAVASNSCGDTIAAGASCTLGITFTPQQPGNAVDQLTLSSPSLDGPLTVALSGSGEDFQLSVTGSSSDLVTNGQTASYHVVVTPVGVSAGTLTITCAGVPANASCTMNPATLSVSGGATGSITVTVATGLTTIASLHPPGWRARPGAAVLWKSGAALALLLPCLLLPSRARRTLLALAVAAALVLAPIACGVHASGGSSATTGTTPTGTTPPGKYSITVTASFPGAQRTADLTLTVE